MNMTYPTKKSLPLAIGLNVIAPGLGYMYMGRLVLGIALLLVTMVTVVGGGFGIGLFAWLGFSAIMVLDMVILSNKIRKSFAAATTMACPACAETITRTAVVCRYCQSVVGNTYDATQTSYSSAF